MKLCYNIIGYLELVLLADRPIRNFCRFLCIPIIFTHILLHVCFYNHRIFMFGDHLATLMRTYVRCMSAYAFVSLFLCELFRRRLWAWQPLYGLVACYMHIDYRGNISKFSRDSITVTVLLALNSPRAGLRRVSTHSGVFYCFRQPAIQRMYSSCRFPPHWLARLTHGSSVASREFCPFYRPSNDLTFQIFSE